MLDWLKSKIFGPCELYRIYDGEYCEDLGTEMYYPHANSRPLYLCKRHKDEMTHRPSDSEVLESELEDAKSNDNFMAF
jgi:hypothetical protein